MIIYNDFPMNIIPEYISQIDMKVALEELFEK
jgi:hypothetical protein